MGFSFLVLSILYSVCFLYLNGYIFPKFGEIFYILVEDLVYTIDLGFFSLIYAYNSKVLSFYVVTYFLKGSFLFAFNFTYSWFIWSRSSCLFGLESCYIFCLIILLVRFFFDFSCEVISFFNSIFTSRFLPLFQVLDYLHHFHQSYVCVFLAFILLKFFFLNLIELSLCLF